MGISNSLLLSSNNDDLPLNNIDYNSNELFNNNDYNKEKEEKEKREKEEKKKIITRSYGFFNLDGSLRRPSTSGKDGLYNAVVKTLELMQFPDIISFVEVSGYKWIEKFEQTYPQYKGWYSREQCNGYFYIAWNSTRFTVQSTFTSDLMRYVAVILYDHQVQQSFLYVAVHLPTKGGVWSQHLNFILTLIEELIQEKKIATFAIAGDFNASPDTIENTIKKKNPSLEPYITGVFHSKIFPDTTPDRLKIYPPTTEAGNTIDNLLFENDKKKCEFQLIDIDSRSGYFTHYPVYVALGIVA